MTVKIPMPALSPTMTEGTLTKWLIKVGDQVKAGDVLAEIETDKATMEVEAVDEGKVEKLIVEEGTSNIPVNSTIAILDEPSSTINFVTFPSSTASTSIVALSVSISANTSPALT